MFTTEESWSNACIIYYGHGQSRLYTMQFRAAQHLLVGSCGVQPACIQGARRMHCVLMPRTPGGSLLNCCWRLLEDIQRLAVPKWPAQAKRKPSEAPVHPALPATMDHSMRPQRPQAQAEVELREAAGERVRAGRRGRVFYP